MMSILKAFTFELYQLVILNDLYSLILFRKNKVMVETVDIKKFVNEIFARKGLPPVKNFAAEFADGSKYITNNTCVLTINFIVRF